MLQVAWVLLSSMTRLTQCLLGLLQAAFNAVPHRVVAPVAELAMLLATLKLAAYKQLELFWEYPLHASSCLAINRAP